MNTNDLLKLIGSARTFGMMRPEDCAECENENIETWLVPPFNVFLCETCMVEARPELAEWLAERRRADGLGESE